MLLDAIRPSSRRAVPFPISAQDTSLPVTRRCPQPSRCEVSRRDTSLLVSPRCPCLHMQAPLEPRHILYACPDSKASMALTMDQWGDRYSAEASASALSQAMRLVRASIGTAAVPAAVPAAVADAWAPAPPSGAADSDGPPNGDASDDDEATVRRLLRSVPETEARALTRGPSTALVGLVAYAPRAAVRLRLRLAGAAVVSSPTAGVTHAVLPPSSAADHSAAGVRAALTRARIEAAEHGGGALGVSAWLVSEAWLDACEIREEKAEEAPYALREGRAPAAE